MVDDIESDRRPMVGVVGDGTLAPGDPKEELGRRLGKELVSAGYRVACGGLSGVMRSVCGGAHASDRYREGMTVGILPGSEPADANEYVDIAIPTGLRHARNALVAQSDAVVALGGGAGTLSEMAMAWIMERLLVAFRVEGWSGRAAGEPLDRRDRFPQFEDDRVFGVDEPDEVVELLDTRLARYRAARRR